jgi:hypothetical protein
MKMSEAQRVHWAKAKRQQHIVLEADPWRRQLLSSGRQHRFVEHSLSTTERPIRTHSHRKGQEALLKDEPVEEPAQRGQVLLDGRRGQLLGLDIGRDIQRPDRGQPEIILFAPGMGGQSPGAYTHFEAYPSICNRDGPLYSLRNMGAE